LSDEIVTGLHVLERRVAAPTATVVCVHGSIDRGGSFARVARRLDHFDVVAYDRRGYQGSRELGPLSLDAHAGDLLEIVDRERRRGPVVVLGHSYGGVVALAAAVREPRAVDLLVLYESPLRWVLARPGFHHEVDADPAAEAEGFFRRMVSNAAWERLSEPERNARRADGPALVDDLRTVRGPSPFRLESLSTPLTYAHGDGERRGYHEALADELARLVPGTRGAELRGAGHGAHLANPDQLAHLIEAEWEFTCASA
jgi:pimeloyl-ACP methyl ester carboxylesterase